MRKRLWQLHSWLGLLAGLGLLVIGASGSLLVFHDEIEAALRPAAMRVSPEPAGRLPLDPLLAAVNRALPDCEVVGWSLGEHGLADRVYVVRHGGSDWLSATLDPFAGRVLSGPLDDDRTFTGWLLKLHYTLFAGAAGELVAGLLALALLLLGATGAWLYRSFWKNLLILRWGRGARILFSDLHKFVGITSAAFNLLLGFTGAYWNLTSVAGAWTRGAGPAPPVAARPYSTALSLDQLDAEAARRLPGFRAAYIGFPGAPGDPVTFYGAVPTANPLRSPSGSTVVFDARTGDFKSADDIRRDGAWAQLTDMFCPLHYGAFGGLPVKILWTLGGLAPGALAVTGFVLWRLRRRGRGD